MIQFTITGNQEDKAGNPIPYHRTTQRSYWDKEAKRYNAWKEFVRQEYWLQTKKVINNIKPFDKTFRGRLEVRIEFGSENHADPDNVGKGILDALFMNDKHVDLTTSHTCQHAGGKVTVLISEYGEIGIE